MPRISARSTAGKNGPSKSKKAKQEDIKIDDIGVRFEWEGDGDKWIQYSRALNKKIAEAFEAKKKQVEIEVATGVKMTVSFETSIQKNKRTGYGRRVRVAMRNDEDDEFKVIEWEGDDKLYHPYGIQVSLDLEKALSQKKTSLKTSFHNIDLKKMTQTNPTTNKSRKMRKGVQDSDAAAGDDEEEEEAEEEEEEEEVKPSKGKSTRKSGKAKSSGKKGDEEEEDEEEEVKPSKGKSASKSGKAKSSGKNGEEKSTVKTVVVKKGRAPVDSSCPIAEKCSVYEKGKDVWDCMLNQTNIGNNNNKFYLIQLLKTDGKEEYHCWQRWGRVGYGGQTNLVPCGNDLQSSMAVFEKKFLDKTSNNWRNRDLFGKRAGKYDLLQMDYSTEGKESMDVDEDEPDDTGDKKEKEKVPDSKLDEKVQELIKLICDIKSMEDEIVEMKYDTKKAPLGKLTKDQVKAGYSALKEIETLINKSDFGPNLRDACSDFYTRIPHVFGMQVPPLIRSSQDVKKKLQLLEALEDIEIAIKLLKGGDMSENPLDRHYHQLKCQLDPVDKTSDTFKLIEAYIQKTHATTHVMYKLELDELFTIDRDGEAARFKDHGNRVLLYHGSRLTNWAGILGQGLRIAPPEAPVTGYMFGKGVYFADMSSKSANYCFANKSRSTGVMVLCDVSLGSVEEKLHADPNAATLPAGKHSVMGMGMKGPDEKTHVTMPDGLVVPVGKEANTNVQRSKAGFTLNYNEYIVYDTSQIKMKYLVKVKFNFK